MADICVKESPFYNKSKSIITTSTPLRSIDDSGYNSSSTLSTVSSNLSQISEVSITFNDRSSSNCEKHQVSATTLSLSLDHSRSKLEDITNRPDSNISISPSATRQEISPTKQLKLSSDLRLYFKSNNDDGFLLRRKNVPVQKSVNHERVSVDGREKIDIMYFLAERHHFEPVTEKIFSFLSGSDILSMSMVSKVWCKAVKNSPMAQKKKRTYFKLSKENRDLYNGRDRSTYPNKGCLANISNVMRSPSKRDLPQRSPPVSPSKYRFHVFQKEAKKLSSDQQLVPCPRCSRPASWSPSQSSRAECKGYHCKFIFCTKCLCEYSDNFEHKCLSMPILSMSSSYSRRPMSNLTKRKHNLRRL